MAIQLTETGSNTTPERLREVEQIIGSKLPEQYKAFLLNNNGGRPEPTTFRTQWDGQAWADGWQETDLHFFLSINPDGPSDFLTYYRRYKGRIPDDTVCIAHDAGRSQILLGIGQQNYNQVFFWVGAYEVEEGETPDYSNVGFVANSFDVRARHHKVPHYGGLFWVSFLT